MALKIRLIKPKKLLLLAFLICCKNVANEKSNVAIIWQLKTTYNFVIGTTT